MKFCSLLNSEVWTVEHNGSSVERSRLFEKRASRVGCPRSWREMALFCWLTPVSEACCCFWRDLDRFWPSSDSTRQSWAEWFSRATTLMQKRWRIRTLQQKQFSAWLSHLARVSWTGHVDRVSWARWTWSAQVKVLASLSSQSFAWARHWSSMLEMKTSFEYFLARLLVGDREVWRVRWSMALQTSCCRKDRVISRRENTGSTEQYGCYCC